MAWPRTLSFCAQNWIRERRARGFGSVDDDWSRLRLHVLPRLGSLKIEEVRPRHIRELVRALIAEGKLAPRSIRNVYGAMHVLFHDAHVDEIIANNPCVVKRG